MTEINQLIQQFIQSGDRPHPDLLAAILAQGEAAIPPLIAIIRDPRMYWDDVRNQPRWLPDIAIGLLGDLRAEAAVPTLIELLGWHNMDLRLEQVVDTLARIGPAAVEPTRAVVLDRSLDWYPRSLAALSLVAHVYRDQENTQPLVDFLQELLCHGPIEHPNDRVVYTLLAHNLADLQGMDAVDAVQTAFDRGAIDPYYLDWPDAETMCRNGNQRQLESFTIDFLPDYRAQYGG